MNVLCLIPAPSDSKAIPNQSDSILAGKTLLQRSIECSAESERINRTIVSTDCETYAVAARGFGAETPFLRPKPNAEDDSSELETFAYALRWLKQHEQYTPEVCVLLRPDSPLREAGEIDAMVDRLIDNPELDSVRSVSPSLHSPYRCFFMDEEGMLSPTLRHDTLEEPWNEPAENLPPTYIHNGSIDVVRTSVISERHSISGTRISAFIQPDYLEIGSDLEFARAALLMGRREDTETSSKVKTFCFDIDGVIATISPDLNYANSKPRLDMIRHINCLYDLGHTIVLSTARGAKTGISWSSVTRQQMRDWGVKHHDLLFNKPAANFYIDDRMISFEQLDEMMETPEQI